MKLPSPGSFCRIFSVKKGPNYLSLSLRGSRRNFPEFYASKSHLFSFFACSMCTVCPLRYRCVPTRPRPPPTGAADLREGQGARLIAIQVPRGTDRGMDRIGWRDWMERRSIRWNTALVIGVVNGVNDQCMKNPNLKS